MHLRNIRRDPTPLLVLGLVAVIAALFATRFFLGGPDPVAASAPEVDPPTTSSDAGSPGPGDPRSQGAPPTSPEPPAPATGPPTLDVEQRGRRKCVETGTSSELTVVSYNIKSGQGNATLAQLAAVLRASEADVILLQEVDQLRYSSGRVDMPTYFGSQLDMTFAYGKNVYHADGGSYGTVILSRFPILSVDNTYLPRPGATQQRGLLHAVIDVDGIEISVYNTHLQNADEPARLLQVAAVNTLTAADPRPRLLGGVLNATPGSRPMGVLGTRWTDTWNVVGSGPGQTAPAGAPRARIDYLLYAGEGIVPLASDVLTSFASDHRPVRAAYRLEVPGEPICFQQFG